MKQIVLLFAFLNFWTNIFCQTDEVIILSNKGATLNNSGQYQAAIESLNESISIDPAYATAYYNRGTSLMYLERYYEAIKDFDRAIELNPEDDEAYFNRSECNKALNDFKSALTDLNKAISINKADDYYASRAGVYYMQEEFENGIEDYTSAIELNPKSEYYTYRAFLKEELGAFNEAILDYNKAIEFDSSDYRNYYDRGNAFLVVGLTSKACEDWKTALNLGDIRKIELEEKIEENCR